MMEKANALAKLDTFTAAGLFSEHYKFQWFSVSHHICKKEMANGNTLSKELQLHPSRIQLYF
jgi:hypothetical protein